MHFVHNDSTLLSVNGFIINSYNLKVIFETKHFMYNNTCFHVQSHMTLANIKTEDLYSL